MSNERFLLPPAFGSGRAHTSFLHIFTGCSYRVPSYQGRLSRLAQEVVSVMKAVSSLIERVPKNRLAVGKGRRAMGTVEKSVVRYGLLNSTVWCCGLCSLVDRIIQQTIIGPPGTELNVMCRPDGLANPY